MIYYVDENKSNPFFQDPRLDVPKEVRAAIFLKNFKEIVTDGRGLDFVNRQENLKSLLDLGLTRKNAEHEILGLSVSDYCSGPEPDQDRGGSMWMFGKTIGAKEVYIKLKIAGVGDVKIAKCISFHVAKYPLCYPLK